MKMMLKLNISQEGTANKINLLDLFQLKHGHCFKTDPKFGGGGMLKSLLGFGHPRNTACGSVNDSRIIAINVSY